MDTWTAYCGFNGDSDDDGLEEIDVHAETEAQARKLVETELASGYEKGLEIKHLVRRAPGLFF